MPGVKRRIKKIRTLLSQEQTHILETAFILMIPSLLTKITGQFFNLVLASFYGTTDTRLNQFFIANSIPELLTSVLMVGAVGTVIIPVLISVKSKSGKEKFYEVYSSIINATILVFTTISLFLIIFADKFIPWAIQLVGSEAISSDLDAVNNAAILENMANMMRLLILPQLILGISVFVSSGLNVYNRFIVPQLSPLFYNIGRILSVVILIPLLDKSPWAIVIGVYVGSLLHLAIQIPLFLRLGIKYYFKIDLRDKNILEVAKLGIPRMFVLASDHIALVINKFIAIGFKGGPASLEYSKSLYLVIPSLFGYTFAYSSYPTLSRLYVEGDKKEIKSIVQKTISEIIFLALPFVVTIMVLRVPIVRLIFGVIPGTELELADTLQIAWMLFLFSFGLIFITARWFVFSLFYATKETLIPSIISFFSLISVLLLSVLLTNLLSHNTEFAIRSVNITIENLLNRAPGDENRVGVGGIPLAMSIVYSIEFFIMLFVFNRFKINIGLSQIINKLIKKLTAGFGMFIVMYFMYKIWDVISLSISGTTGGGLTGSTALNLTLFMLVTIIPSFLVYYLLCLLLKVDEMKILSRYLNPIFRIAGLKI